MDGARGVDQPLNHGEVGVETGVVVGTGLGEVVLVLGVATVV